MIIKEAQHYGVRYLSGLPDTNIANVANEVKYLLAKAVNLPYTQLIFEQHRALTPAEQDCFEQLLARRLGREPLQHILGDTEFFGLRVLVEPGVFVPRPETEVLVDELVRRVSTLTSSPVVIDLCTGSGVIALATKHLLPTARVLGCDVDARAVALAQKNAELLGLDVEFIHSDLLYAVTERHFDVMVSNPPYLPHTDAATVSPEVAADPPHALYAGPDGLVVARRIVELAAGHLRPGGVMALELDPRNARHLANTLNPQHWRDIEVVPDLSGRERFVFAQYAPELP
jgi:release factor glutamine methyltransferase